MIITLAGLSGAGKSTVKKMLAEKLGWKAYSMGDMRGVYATEHGMTIDELNTLGMSDPQTDSRVDEFQTELGKREDNFVIDGWMSWFFIPNSVKIFLDINPEEGAKRIFAEQQNYPDHRKDERPYASVTDVQENLAKRVLQNQERYKKWYQVDFLDTSHYDLVIDTSALSPEQVVERITAFISSHA
ncbi:MAG: cytidylate kinase family protein [Patescibacteria group bacterium]